jgi:hypothetical protein
MSDFLPSLAVVKARIVNTVTRQLFINLCIVGIEIVLRLFLLSTTLWSRASCRATSRVRLAHDDATCCCWSPNSRTARKQNEPTRESNECVATDRNEKQTANHILNSDARAYEQTRDDVDVLFDQHMETRS